MADTPDNPSDLSDEDWSRVGERIIDTYNQRKRERSDDEGRWEEIDRQLAMKPVKQPIKSRAKWLPAVEVPMQSYTLETLKADCRRMMFPSGKSFFVAHAALGDDDLQRLDYDGFIGPNPENRTTAQHAAQKLGVQAFADVLVRRRLDAIHSRYGMREEWDLVVGEAIKYGAYCGRMHMVDDDRLVSGYRGIKSKRFPAFQACSIKTTYLDDAPPRLLGEGLLVAPSPIREYWLELSALRVAMTKGGDKEGWLKSELEKLKPDRKGMVHLLEYDGDLLIPQTADDIFVPGVTVTVAKESGNVVRYQEHEYGFRPWISGNYEKDHIDSVYGTSPLIKGYPIQAAASACLTWLLAVAALNALPPVRTDGNDYKAKKDGGIRIEPATVWESVGEVEVMKIGDPVALLQAYTFLLAQYADTTGMSAPRLGAQTKSHQSAFAVDSEVTRGLVRTVDFVQELMGGALTSFLHMEYEMAKKMDREMVYITEVNAFVDVRPEQLPVSANFEVTGAGTPLEDRQKQLNRVQALQTLIQIYPMVAQLKAQGAQVELPDLNLLQRLLLQEGGYIDQELFFPGAAPGAQAVPGAATGGPGVPGLEGVLAQLSRATVGARG